MLDANAMYFMEPTPRVVYDKRGVASAVSNETYFKAMAGLVHGYSVEPPRFIDMPWGKRVAV